MNLALKLHNIHTCNRRFQINPSNYPPIFNKASSVIGRLLTCDSRMQHQQLTARFHPMILNYILLPITKRKIALAQKFEVEFLLKNVQLLHTRFYDHKTYRIADNGGLTTVCNPPIWLNGKTSMQQTKCCEIEYHMGRAHLIQLDVLFKILFQIGCVRSRRMLLYKTTYCQNPQFYGVMCQPFCAGADSTHTDTPKIKVSWF